MAAERGNHKCGVGIAYNAGIGGVKIIGGGVTDHMEATALSYRRDLVDIYSNSWGPNDGNTVEGPAPLAKCVDVLLPPPLLWMKLKRRMQKF